MDVNYNNTNNCENRRRNDAYMLFLYNRLLQTFPESEQQGQSPPSYFDAINNRIQPETRQTKSRIKIAARVVGVCVVAVFIAFLFLVRFIIFICGVVYLHDCPTKPCLPVYLIVAGLADIMPIVLYGAKFERVEKVCQIIGFIWFCVGNYWLFRTVGSWSNNPSDGNYCNPVLFYVVYCYIVLNYFLVFLNVFNTALLQLTFIISNN